MSTTHIDLLNFLSIDLAKIGEFCFFNETNIVVAVDGCRLIYGILPLNEIVEFAKKFPADAIVDGELSMISGCNIAGGLSADTQKLKTRLKPFYIDRVRRHYAERQMSQSARDWLETGERGTSSETIFHRVLGIAIDDNNLSASTSPPYNGRDFRRCRLLIEQVPEIESNLQRMADVSPSWANLIQNWPDLANEMDRECPDWRSRPAGSFEKTSSAIRKVLN